jgi:hypothetical protein
MKEIEKMEGIIETLQKIDTIPISQIHRKDDQGHRGKQGTGPIQAAASSC